MEMERKTIQKENRCVEVAEEYPNHNKQSKCHKGVYKWNNMDNVNNVGILK